MNKQLFKTTKESEIVLTELMLPSYSNFSGKIHGGFILSLKIKLLLRQQPNLAVIIVLQHL